MADITGLLQAGVTIEEILAGLQTDFQDTVGRFKNQSKTTYEEAMESIENFYNTAAADRNEDFEDRYGILSDNLANLGMNFSSGELANQWEEDFDFLRESADTALATDLSWFEKMKTSQAELYNALLVEMAAQQALIQATPVGNSGGGGGGYGGGYSSGGSSSSDVGDWDETTSVTLRDDFQRDFPGFIEAVNESYASGDLDENQWAYFNALIDQYEEPKDMLGQIVDDTDESVLAIQAAQNLMEMLNSEAPGVANVPLPMGPDGAFQWQQREIPGISSIENLDTLDEARNNTPGQQAFGTSNTLESFLRPLAENPYVASNTALEGMEEVGSARRAFDEVMMQREQLGAQAQNTINEGENFIGYSDPIRGYLRNWDPIRGWVNTEQTMDDYFRSQKKEYDQPAPPSVDTSLEPDSGTRQNLQRQAAEAYWNQGGSYTAPDQRRENENNNLERIQAARQLAQSQALAHSQNEARLRKEAEDKRRQEAARNVERERWNNAGSYSPIPSKAVDPSLKSNKPKKNVGTKFIQAR